MEDPALSPSADDSDPIPQIQQKVEGDGNQIITNLMGGNAINRVEGNVIYNYYYYYYREELQIDIDINDNLTDANQLPCPYRGLFHFGPGDAKYFFGRESFVEELVRATQTRNFIPLLGASGNGKSSVVFAGLVPKLQQIGHWQFTHFRPGADPFHALAVALVPLYTSNLDETERIRQSRNLASYFRTEEVLLSDVFAQIQQNYPTDRVLLIADQFEELYTLCTDEATRYNFLDKLLAGIATNKTSFAPVLVTTMRADFLENALSYRPFADVLQNTDLKLGPMNQGELAEVIEKPAQKLGVTFETGLVKRILGDVEGEPGILPLLEFALTELWQRRSSKQLTHTAYEEIGGVQGALDRHANQEYDKLNDADQERVRRIFIQLVRPGEGVEDTRRIAIKEELEEESWLLVKQLADARLVVTSRNDTGQETVEVVHEALIRNWGELKLWMETDRVFRSWQERLRAAKRQWNETKGDKGSLLRGAALAEAEEQLRKRPEELVSESDFIEISLQERERQEQAEAARRKSETILAWRITGGSLLAVIVSGGLGWMAWKQTQQAELNLADVISASALSLVDKGEVLDAFIPAIRAGKILKNQQASNPSGLHTLQEALNHRSERNRLEGHQDHVYSVSFSPDGKILASGSRDNTIKLWNIATGKEISTLYGHQKPVDSVSFSPNGKTLASGSADTTIKLWNLETGKEIHTLHGHQSSVLSVSFSPDGKILASGSFDDTIKLWNLETGEEIHTLHEHKNPVYSVSFSPDGKTLASGSADTTIKLWNLETGKEIRSLKGHKNNVKSVSFSPDGKILATGSDDTTIKLWNLETGKEIRSLKGHKNNVKSVSFNPNGKTLATGSGDNTIKLWNLETGEEIRSLKGHRDHISSVSFSPDGKTLATGSDDNTIKLWNLEMGNTLQGHKWHVNSVSFSPDGKTLASGGDDIKLWKVATGKEVQTLYGHQNSVYSVSFSPDSKILATSSWDTTIKLWNVDTGKEIRTLHGHQGYVNSVSFSPNGQILATGGDDTTTKLWNVNTGQEIHTLKGHQNRISNINFSPDGKTLASGSWDKTIKLWNLNTGKEIHTFYGHQDSVLSVSFSPDGKTLASGGDDIKLWNLATGKEIRTLKGQKVFVHSVIFSPDGKTLANGGDSIIKLWDLDTGKKIRTLQRHQDSVLNVSFSPDGKTLASGSADKTIELWNLDLDTLMGRSCDWVQPYLENNINVSKNDKHLCDDIGTKKQ
jgi:WD40 repeat protein